MSDDQSRDIANLRAEIAALSLAAQKQFGQILAVESALLTFVETHQNPALFLQKLSVNLEPTEALLLGSSKSEAGLVAFQEARARLNDSCQIAIARQALGE